MHQKDKELITSYKKEWDNTPIVYPPTNPLLDTNAYKEGVRQLMDDCIFCKLAGGTIPVKALVETGRLIIISDRSPVAKDHVLVIPKEHTSNITETPIDHISYLIYMASLYGKEHMPNGFRIVINTGDDAGQTVKHFHIHVIGGEKLKDL